MQKGDTFEHDINTECFGWRAKMVKGIVRKGTANPDIK
jgi:hypothetical protein